MRVEAFVHCSSIHQGVDTANVFFAGQSGLVLLCIDESRLAAELEFENPTGVAKHDPTMEELFPHVYGPINLDAVVEVVEFPPDEDGTFSLPDDVDVRSSTRELPVQVVRREAATLRAP